MESALAVRRGVEDENRAQPRSRDQTGTIRVSAAEFHQHSSRYQDLALSQPVVITRNGRERTAMISVAEYERLKRRDRQVLSLDDFTAADLAALAATRTPEESKAFDDELNA